MDASTALSLRLSSLLLGSHPCRSVLEVAEWFGAMQAQDLNSVLWSLGARLSGSSLASVIAETEERTVVRTWPMRGTVHLIPSADAHWMLQLTGVRALAGAAKRREILGLSEETVDKAAQMLGEALAGGRRLTRSECLAALTDGGVAVSGQLGYHLLWYASQLGVTAIAPNRGTEQTFVLLDEWAASRVTYEREEGLAILARRYFQSHGPAPLKDFAGWTGLTMGDCRLGATAAGLVAVDVDGTAMWATPETLDAGPVRGWWALPGFDEYMLGYKDRSLMATPDQVAAVIPGGNGVFQSTLVRDGHVMATWKRALGRKAVTITVNPLADFDLSDAQPALERYAAYLDLPMIVKPV
ncbi:winged helix DNA-binding domain-containing protein [Actinoplanes rectilineatus]|uniref:winged helix DNA-binding domain-containing protein n=1 Tax=Actinoplanes rectilineatus TaxID=113571 RepID=UPI0005F2883D|nr:winged helix DNA-binding domain-containing protein [Actinoplanes rectilineatus]